MLRSLASPLCLLLALVLLILGFASLSYDAPSAPIELHQARTVGDLAYEEQLESRLARRQFSRTVLLVGFFSGSALALALAFLLMDSK